MVAERHLENGRAKDTLHCATRAASFRLNDAFKTLRRGILRMHADGQRAQDIPGAGPHRFGRLLGLHRAFAMLAFGLTPHLFRYGYWLPQQRINSMQD